MDVKFFSSTAGLPASFKTLSGFTMATAASVWEQTPQESPAAASQRIGRTHGVYAAGLAGRRTEQQLKKQKQKQKAKRRKKKNQEQKAIEGGAPPKETEKRAAEDAAPPAAEDGAAEAPADDAVAASAPAPAPPATPSQSADSLALTIAGQSSYSEKRNAQSAQVRLQLQNELRGADEGLGLLDTSEVKDWLKDLGLGQYWPSFCTSGYKTFEDVVRLDGTLVHTQLAVFRPAHAVKLERAIVALRKERGVPEPQYKMPKPPSGGLSPRTRRARARQTHKGYVNPGASPRTTAVAGQSSTSKTSLAVVPRSIAPGASLADAKIRKTIGGTQIIGGYAMPPSSTRDPYTGETREGKPHGHGVMTGPDGRVYEGEWRDGRRCGKGEETLRSGERYVGDWDGDEKSGFGIWEGADGSRYEGSYRNGQWQGKGRYDAADGTTFEGMWLNGLLHGTGTCKDASGQYTGDWMHGERHGRGHLVRQNGEEYLGEWRHDEQTGAVEKAVIYAPDGSGGVYSGTFREGLPNGTGKLEQEDGGCYEGEWKDGRRDGWGVQKSPNGDTYKGMYHDGLQAGKGVWTCTDGSKYEGDWRMGHRHGEGTWTAASGSTYSGRWQNGAMTGRGTLTLPNGHQQSGEFREGVIWRGAWMDNNGSLLGGWRAGKYYPGRDSSGRLLQALPELMAKPAALLLEDAGSGTQHADESEGAGAQEAQDECAAPHEALRFPALVA